MSGFALNLDLTLYFEDLRKYACVFVDSTKCKEVGDVEDHIKAVFKLEDNICLTNKKFLIPRCESIGILQQYDTLKVQKCDFYDYQIHKNKKSNPACDQSALNLIQSDRTIDLSCRPKQRFKINICQNRCILEAPLTPFENNQIDNCSQQIVLSNEKLLGGNSEAQTKFKTKNKKRKYDFQNDELEDNNDENFTRILDMSVKKSKKKNKNDVMIDETSQINMDSPINCEMQLEIDQQKLKKLKKKKKQLQVDETDLTSTCWKHVANERISKKHKSQKNLLNEEFSGFLASSFSVSGNCEGDKKECKQNMNIYEEGCIRKKRNSENKSAANYSNNDQELPDKIPSKLNKEQNILETHSPANKDLKDDVNVGFKISKKRIEDYKRALEEDVCRSLQKDSENSYLDLEEDPGSLLSTSKVTNSSPMHQDNNECIKINGKEFHSDNISLDSEMSTQIKCKRKRIRKHNKKKRREKLSLLNALGPVLDRITSPSEIKSSPASSDLTKHIYFNDEDFIDEMKIPITPPEASQSHLQGTPDDKTQNKCQDNTGASSSRATDGETKTWQQDFLKMTTLTSQPLIFHRSAPSPAISDKNDSPCKSSNTSSTSMPQNCIESECSNVVKDIPKEQQSLSKDYTSCNGEQTVLSNLEVDLKANIKSRSNCSSLKAKKQDLKKVILTEYPVIDKVVAEDFILFKVLKLGENCEPICSNPILAKVKNATNFPDNIFLQIMEGIEECDSLTRSIDNNEECLDIELRWSDIVEPRLFYP